MKASLEKAPRRPLPGLCLLLAGCGGNTMIYQQAELDSFLQQQQGRALSFQTRAGNQIAFYFPPKADPSAPPAPLVICHPGIGSRALDWLWLPERSPEPPWGTRAPSQSNGGTDSRGSASLLRKGHEEGTGGIGMDVCHWESREESEGHSAR